MIASADWTKVDLFRADLRLKVRYLKKCYPVATRAQLMCKSEKGIYVTRNWRADDAKVSQLPGDRRGG
jgi:hypothetical protein